MRVPTWHAGRRDRRSAAASARFFLRITEGTPVLWELAQMETFPKPGNGACQAFGIPTYRESSLRGPIATQLLLPCVDQAPATALSFRILEGLCRLML
jgi:hypothetical protein